MQLFVQIEAAHDTVDELGNLGIIEFKDLNPEVNAFQRNFVNEVKRCDEMDRKLSFFAEQVDKELNDIIREKNGSEADIQKFYFTHGPSSDKHLRMDELETQFGDLEKELTQMNNNQEMLTRNFNELIELKHVLAKDTAFFSEAARFDDDDDEHDKQHLLSEAEEKKAVKIGYLTGVIQSDKFISFERVLWRSTRGNLFMKHAPIEEPIKDAHTGNLVNKDVFIIFFQGERAQAKIKKICESFGANMYPCPNTGKERKELLGQINTRIEDLETVLARTKKHRRQVLLDVGKNLQTWRAKVAKEKAIYDTMNLFNYDIGRRCLIAEGWCPKNSTEVITAAMRRATESSGALVPSILSVIATKEEPPTYFRTNKFTLGFQNIVESYGVAHYREANPTVFAVITFPFIFAVMFGDVGHGILLTLAAVLFVAKEKELSKGPLNEMIKTAFDGRYVLLLMGLFSIYTGALYNEAFSVAMDFGSHFKYHGNDTTATFDGGVYGFGVDPAWNGAQNSLNFYNSVKMKLSIILGVTQMCLGIFLSLFNGLYFKKPLDIQFEFIPQIIFMLSLFGYLVFMIIYKWCNTFSNPPYLLNVMIDMFLAIGSVSSDDRLYDGQAGVQVILVLIAVACVPVMLLGKPFMLKRQHAQHLKLHPTAAAEDDGEHGKGHGGHGGHDGEEFDFGEVMVHQTIHTIEFVLGAISNTASYLRLWALSLAHSELSLVFYELLLLNAYSAAQDLPPPINGIAIFIGIGAWSGCTLGVLMVMESLSAFLHALRLHWVEFMGKFYKGDGRQFKPFSYERIFTKADD